MKFEIKKLEGTSNYLTWQASIKVYLNDYDLIEITTGNIPELPTNTTDNKYLLWKKMGQNSKTVNPHMCFTRLGPSGCRSPIFACCLDCSPRQI
jgi:hypothetical protein